MLPGAVVPEIYGGMEVPFPIILQIFRYLARMYVDRIYGFPHLSLYPSSRITPESLRYFTFAKAEAILFLAAGQVIIMRGEEVDMFTLNGRWG